MHSIIILALFFPVMYLKTKLRNCTEVVTAQQFKLDFTLVKHTLMLRQI